MKSLKIFIISSAILAMAATSCSNGSKNDSQKDSTNIEQTSNKAEASKYDLSSCPGDATAPIGEYQDGVTKVANQKALIALLNDKIETPIFIDFGATWCGPCKQFKPAFEDIANRYADRAQFFAVDIDQCPELASQLNIEGVPTLIVKYTNGTNATFVGTQDILPAEKFETIVQKAIENK